MKYPWSANPLKLQRAIEKANIENRLGASDFDKDARVKELYISMGGKLESIEEVDLSDNNHETHMNEEEVLPAEKVADDVEISTDSTDTQEEVKADLEGSPEQTIVSEDSTDLNNDEGAETVIA